MKVRCGCGFGAEKPSSVHQERRLLESPSAALPTRSWRCGSSCSARAGKVEFGNLERMKKEKACVRASEPGARAEVR